MWSGWLARTAYQASACEGLEIGKFKTDGQLLLVKCGGRLQMTKLPCQDQGHAAKSGDRRQVKSDRQPCEYVGGDSGHPTPTACMSLPILNTARKSESRYIYVGLHHDILIKMAH